MSILLDGLNGITTPSETVQGALTTTGNTILGDATTDTLNVGAGGLVKDASGNVGIGVTPSAWLSTDRAIELTAGALDSVSATDLRLYQNAYNGASGSVYKTSNFASLYRQTSGQHIWYSAPSGTAGNAITLTQAMTLDASGNLLVGNASQMHVPGRILSYATGNNVALFVSTDIAGYQCIQFWNRATSGQRYYTQFEVGASHVATGYIYTSDGTSTTYATTSDQRLKENIVDASSGLTKISNVKIRSFDWISTKGKVDFGVIAQELYDVAPECVGVGEDNEDGTINKPWSVDISFLVPALIKSVQELKAIVDAQAVRIAALEA
jgi:hypothetical protein